MKPTAIFSSCGKYRYELHRIWSLEVKRLVLWIMLNPSTADEFNDDPTIRRCINFSKAWGYDGLMIGNVYALRSTDPRGLWLDDDPIGIHNYQHLTSMAQTAELIVAGWGGMAIKTDAELAVNALTVNKPLHCLVINKDGSPKHPLYVRGDQQPRVYRMVYRTAEQ